MAAKSIRRKIDGGLYTGWIRMKNPETRSQSFHKQLWINIVPLQVELETLSLYVFLSVKNSKRYCFNFCFRFSNTFPGTLEEKMSLSCLPGYLLFWFLFHRSWCSEPKFPGIVSLLSEELPLSNSFKAELLATNSLSFPSSVNVFISPSSLTDIFTAYRILGWQFLQAL